MKIKKLNSHNDLSVLVEERYKELNPKRYSITGIDRVAKYILSNKERLFFIVGDYDCDGIFATAILVKIFEYYNIEYKYHLPRRFSEGYGLNEKIVDEIPEGSVLITIDNGIVAFDAVEKAKNKGCGIIIIDHHLGKEDGLLPCADYIIDPNAISGQCEYTDYCGAGLGFKLAEAMKLDEDTLAECEMLAAYATIADCVNLTGENFLIAQKIKEGWRNDGLSLLLKKCGIFEPNEDNVGFQICPSVNAPGRLLDDGAEIPLKLLISNDFSEMDELTKQMFELNEQRKQMVDETMEKIIPLVNSSDNLTCVISDMSEGIVGIVAGRLAEKYKTPAIVFTSIGERDGKEILKGSARTYGENHIKMILDSCSEFLIKYGGHAAAAGLSLYKDNFDKFKDEASKHCVKTEENEEITYDMDLEPDEAGKETERSLELLKKVSPFGQANEKFKFRFKGIKLIPRYGKLYKSLGKDGKYLKFFGKDLDILCFDIKPNPNDFADKADVIGYICKNQFAGKETLQIEAKYLAPEEANYKIAEIGSLFAARAAERK